MTLHAPRLETFVQRMSPDGGWGYAPGLSPQLEPSCLGSARPCPWNAAIRSGNRANTPVHRAERERRRQLSSAAGPRGSDLADVAGPVREGRAGWQRPEMNAPRLPARPRVGRVPDQPEAGELHDIDLKLSAGRGRKTTSRGSSRPRGRAWRCARVGQGEPSARPGRHAMLLDRAMDDGGINYGNRRILGKMTEPIPGPTALMLLALQGQAHPRIDAAVRLSDRADQHATTWSISAGRRSRSTCIAICRASTRHCCGARSAHHRGRTKNAGRRGWLKPTLLSAGADDPRAGRRARQRLSPVPPRVRSVVARGAASSAAHACTRERRRQFRSRRHLVSRLSLKALSKLRPLPLQLGRPHRPGARTTTPTSSDICKSSTSTSARRCRSRASASSSSRTSSNTTATRSSTPIPQVVAAVIELCKREGAAEIIVAEGPGHWRNVEYLVSASGLGDVLKQHDVPFVDLNHDEPVKTPNLGRLTGLEYLYLSRTDRHGRRASSRCPSSRRTTGPARRCRSRTCSARCPASATAGRRTSCTGAASTTASSTSP